MTEEATVKIDLEKVYAFTEEANKHGGYLTGKTFRTQS
jgi:hypothetical protein